MWGIQSGNDVAKFDFWVFESSEPFGISGFPEYPWYSVATCFPVLMNSWASLCQPWELDAASGMKWRRFLHSSRVGFPSVNMSASWCLVSMCLIWIYGSKVILSNNQSRATPWVLDTCLIVGLLPLIIILVTASLSSKTFNIALEWENFTFEGTLSTWHKSRLSCLVGTLVWFVVRLFDEVLGNRFPVQIDPWFCWIGLGRNELLL